MESELKFECNENGDGAPKSPASKLFLKLYSSTSEQVINCAMTFRHPIDVEALKNDISKSIMLKHPRFCCFRVRDDTGEHWKNAPVNIDDHIIIHHTTTTAAATTASQVEEEEEEAAINAFLAEISVSTPLSQNKPLWEVHVLLHLKCVVLRVHHALGDGASLMSMLSACFGKQNNDELRNNNNNNKGDERSKKGVWWVLKSLWYTFVFMLRILGRMLWVKDNVHLIRGGDGVELWPRKLVTAKFLLHDFKSIKTLIPHVTINDVLLGVISSGISKYLYAKSSFAFEKPLQLTAILAVNLRKHPYIKEISSLMSLTSNSSSGWGNKSSVILLPICCFNGPDPVDHVRAMKATMDKKKLSYEAKLLHKTLYYVGYFCSTKVPGWCCKRVVGKTTLFISNIKGPSEEIAIADNPVTHMRVSLSSLPQAIALVMVSYAGKAYLQVMVAKDIVPDPESLVNYFLDSFVEVKNSVKAINLV